ncbi:hypothetical protein EZS27_015679 [termite gut metagenome]|uniref:Uncharacterized protein n=1 Tax=termite gut metagenome TaxID=433724 RepID=A0A5J4RR57_9ZZZZ
MELLHMGKLKFAVFLRNTKKPLTIKEEGLSLGELVSVIQAGFQRYRCKKGGIKSQDFTCGTMGK